MKDGLALRRMLPLTLLLASTLSPGCTKGSDTFVVVPGGVLPGGGTPPAARTPLAISSSVGSTLKVEAGQPVSFTITVTAESGAIDLNLLNPPADADFAPIRSATSPATATFRTIADPAFQGRRELVFATRTSGEDPETGRLVVTLDTRQGVPTFQSGLLSGQVFSTQAVDVTGDGVRDLISGASFADRAGSDRGAIYLWKGGSTLPSGDPDSTLEVASGADNDRIGRQSLGVQGIRVVDVTGDGVPDVISAAPEADGAGTDRGAIYVWKGGPTITATNPDFVLSVSSGADGDRIGSIDRGSQGLQLVDLTGDGIVDLVAAADRADAGGTDRGAVYVWAGGPNLASGDPDFTLTVSSGADGDRMGFLRRGAEGIQAADLTGDGVLDLLVAASQADRGGAGRGAAYVWKGGAGLASGDPDFVLEVTTGVADNDAMGQTPFGVQGLWCLDVTGDEVFDVLAVTPGADRGGTDRGAVYVWKGGATLKASDPDFVLAVSSASDNDRLGDASLGATSLHLGDLSGDGHPEIVVQATGADLAGTDRGAVYVWTGGPNLAGGNPQFSLQVSTAANSDSLGRGTRGALGLMLEDLTGDGRLDLVASAAFADLGGTDRGAFYVWSGASLASGDPDFTLQVTTGVADNDRLGVNVNDSPGFLLEDVTGDGVSDLVAAASGADRGGTDRGAVYVWRGGATLKAGDPDFALEVTTGVADGDQLGATVTGSVGLLTRDVTGDGVADVIAGASNADRGGTDRGAVYVWQGGSDLAAGEPDFVLEVTTGVADSDRLGLASVANQGVVIRDVSGDGVSDLVISATNADRGNTDRGAVYVWLGGSKLSATGPDAVLEVTTGSADGDRLGLDHDAGGGVFFADLSGAGKPTIVVAATSADLAGTNRGALYLWGAGSTTFSAAPDATLSVSGASDQDGLGLAN